MNTCIVGGVLVLVMLLGFVWWNRPAAEAPQAVWNNASPDLIVVESPLPGEVVPKTFTAAGRARGYWYFEASFPVEILDANGARLLITPAQAEGEWMTEEFVPFSVELSVGTYTGPATLILHRDNPSGEPERDASVEIPIVIR